MVNYIWGLMAGTAVRGGGHGGAPGLSVDNVALMPAVGCLFVVIFGGLTLIFDDAFFIKIKPTVVMSCWPPRWPSAWPSGASGCAM